MRVLQRVLVRVFGPWYATGAGAGGGARARSSAPGECVIFCTWLIGFRVRGPWGSVGLEAMGFRGFRVKGILLSSDGNLCHVLKAMLRDTEGFCSSTSVQAVQCIRM